MTLDPFLSPITLTIVSIRCSNEAHKCGIRGPAHLFQVPVPMDSVCPQFSSSRGGQKGYSQRNEQRSTNISFQIKYVQVLTPEQLSKTILFLTANLTITSTFLTTVSNCVLVIMDTLNLTKAMAKFLQANSELVSCLLPIEAQALSLLAPASILKQILRAVAIQGPSNLTNFDLLPWQHLPVTERLLALQILLWGQRTSRLSSCTLQQLKHAKHQVEPYHGRQAPDISLLYFFLCALTELPPKHTANVEDFISRHQEDEDLVGPALMVLPKASQAPGFYSGLQLSGPNHYYEFFRAIPHFASQPDYLPIVCRGLYTLTGLAFLKMAISHINEIHLILETLCEQALSGHMTERQPEVLNCAMMKFTKGLELQEASVMLPDLPEALIAAVKDPNILSLELLSPMIEPLLSRTQSNHRLISAIKERLESDPAFSKQRANALYHLALKDTEYRSTALGLLRIYSTQHLSEEDSDDIIRYMTSSCKTLNIKIKEAQRRAALNEIYEFDPQDVHTVLDHEFLDFIGELISVTKRGVTINIEEAATTSVRLAADLSNCTNYIQNQLKSAWLTKGRRYYNGLCTTNQGILHIYSSVFSRLSSSVFGHVLADSECHGVIQLYAGFLLLRVFQFNLPETKEESFLISQSIALENANNGAISPLEHQQLEWLTPFLKSSLVRQIYGSLSIKVRDCCELQGRVFFASIADHGVTIFGGVILVNNDYRAEELKARCGLLITMYHEFAHYCRRMPEGMYDVNKLTPTKGGVDSETYDLGTPGDITNQSRKRADGEPKHGEGGYQAEVELYGLVPNCLTKQQAEFLVRHENWVLPLQKFRRRLEKLAKQDNPSYLQYRRGDDFLFFPRRDHQPVYS